MLSIVNPVNMAMNVPCCPHAPHCPHQRPMHFQNLPSLALSSIGANPAWASRTSIQQPPQYDLDRSTQARLYPSELTYLNEQNKIRPASGAYSSPPHTSTWGAPTYPAVSNDFSPPSWYPSRNKDQFVNSGLPPYQHENNDYIPGMKYESMSLRDASPSQATDFSTMSASSQASPAPGGNYIGYNGLRAPKDESPFLSSQPLHPEQLQEVGCNTRRLSVANFGSGGSSKQARTRSRKGSGAILCHVCLRIFDRRSNFKSHWETHDKDRQRTPCRIDGCEKTFGRPAEMTRHVNSAHRLKSFPCDSCGKEFTRHDILLRHCKDACPMLGKGKSNGKKRRSRES